MSSAEADPKLGPAAGGQRQISISRRNSNIKPTRSLVDTPQVHHYHHHYHHCRHRSKRDRLGGTAHVRACARARSRRHRRRRRKREERGKTMGMIVSPFYETRSGLILGAAESFTRRCRRGSTGFSAKAVPRISSPPP